VTEPEVIQDSSIVDWQ